MATVEAAGFAAAYTNNAKYGKGLVNGSVMMMMDTYTFPANAYAINGLISVGKLPAKAKVIDAGISIPASLGTVGIFDLGVVADVDGFVSGADGGGQSAVKKASTEALIGSEFAVETLVQLKCTEATDAALGLTITAWVEYVVD
jgi:hypothetical protein